MTAFSAERAPHQVQTPPPGRRTRRSRVKSPGFFRAFLFLAIGVLFSAGLIVLIRAAYGFPIAEDGGLTTATQNGILLVSLLAAPLFWLVGLGAFDYWFYWAAGRATRAEDHSSHGAHSWRD
jgi:cytochrome c oxidase subunit I